MTSVVSRMHWMDLLRGLAVLLVVILHAAQHGGATVEWWDEANRYLAPFRMPLLMSLSGMLLAHSLAKPLPLYLWGKVAAIGWPLLVWLALYGLLVRGGVGLPNNLVDYLATGDYLWFLMALLACYFFAALFRPLMTRHPQFCDWSFLGVFVLMITASVLSGTIPGLLGNTLWYGSFFFLGAWAQPYVSRWISSPWWASALSLVVVVGVSVIGVNGTNQSLRTPAMAALAVLGIAVALWWAPRIPRSPAVRVISWAGRHSIVVYVAHFPVIMLLRDRVLSHVQVPDEVYVVLITLLSLLLTMLIVWARPWTPWLYVMPRSQRVAARLR